jgi:hypothetical protein
MNSFLIRAVLCPFRCLDFGLYEYTVRNLYVYCRVFLNVGFPGIGGNYSVYLQLMPCVKTCGFLASARFVFMYLKV